MRMRRCKKPVRRHFRSYPFSSVIEARLSDLKRELTQINLFLQLIEQTITCLIKGNVTHKKYSICDYINLNSVRLSIYFKQILEH